MRFYFKRYIERYIVRAIVLFQPWTYCLGNFPHAPIQCWRYQRNQCTQIFTPTLKKGEGGIFSNISSIVLYLSEISFPASDISLPLCDISFQLCDISFLLRDIYHFCFGIYRFCLKRYHSGLSPRHCKIHVHFPKHNLR